MREREQWKIKIKRRRREKSDGDKSITNHSPLSRLLFKEKAASQENFFKIINRTKGDWSIQICKFGEHVFHFHSHSVLFLTVWQFDMYAYFRYSLILWNVFVESNIHIWGFLNHHRSIRMNIISFFHYCIHISSKAMDINHSSIHLEGGPPWTLWLQGYHWETHDHSHSHSEEGIVVEQWLALLPHSKKILGLNPPSR